MLPRTTLLVLTIFLLELGHHGASAQQRTRLYVTQFFSSSNSKEENPIRFLELYDDYSYSWIRHDKLVPKGTYEFLGHYLVLHGATPSEATVQGSAAHGSLTFKWGGSGAPKELVMCVTGSIDWPATNVYCK